MNEILPQPRKPKKYEYRGGTCPKHGNACAMRRCRLTLGPWECVECAHEAGSLQALPPAPPPAPVPPTPTAEPADTAVEGRGVVCSPAGWQGAVMLRDELDRALRRYDYGKLTDADLGIELLRISNDLATESKRLRAAESADGLLHDRIPGTDGRLLASMPIVRPGASDVTPSGGAEALPSGWYRIGDTRYAYGSAFWDTGAPRVDRYGSDPGYRAFAAGALTCVSPWPPTALQAMCAALGISIVECAGSCEGLAGRYTAWLGDDCLVAGPHTKDDCAREALEVHHARQQPAQAAALRQEADEIRKAARELTAPMHATVVRVREMLQRWGAEDAAEAPAEAQCPVLRAFEEDGIVERSDDACKCTYRPDGHRDVSRFCTLHGASWQTLAEQRSELHEDGTPRAGCGYCASTPELDARERGLR